jgi:type I restriction enzyme S subunit
MVRKGFKNTIIGEIPEDWEVGELNHISKISSSKRIFESDYVSYGIPFYRGMEISLLMNNKAIDKPFYISEEKYHFLANRHGFPKRNDLLITAVGTLGNIYHVNNDEKFYFKDGNLIWINNISQNAIFVKIALDYHKQQILDNAIGSSQKALTISSLSITKIPLPKLPEQKVIAEALSDSDTWIENLEQLIAKKRLIKQGAMQQLLTPKEDWEVKKLGDCLSYIQPTKYLVKSTAYHQNNEIPVLTAGKTFILGYTNEVDGIFDSLPTIIFDDFTTASKFVNFPFKAKSSAMKMLITKSENYSLRFLYETLQALDFPKGDHKRHWIGEFQKLEIRIPSLSEQTRIATILSDMDTELESLENTLGKARQIKQGMMQELLTGRVRLV